MSDELTELYNSGEFIEKYGKDMRKDLINVFDKMDDHELAARRLQWCMKYDKVPREIATPSLESFLSLSRRRGHNKSRLTAEAELKQILLKGRIKDQELGIPPDPIEVIQP